MAEAVNNPFEATHSIAFELSNYCPLAWWHKRCPLNLEMASPFRLHQVRHLPARIVYETLDAMGEYDYPSEISFHQYNEPTTDPRLFEFIRYARRVCPRSKIVIVSNGLGVSEQLARELVEAGLSGMWITRYGDEEDRQAMHDWVKDVLIPIMPANMCNVLPWTKLDRRMQLYDDELLDIDRPCHAPLNTLVITRDADVGLCCWDWRRTVTFGNLNDTPFMDILLSDEIREAHRRLEAKDRSIYDICRRCNRAVVP
jgi:MoaA/NifB/PqqE/SkfB family radical SAM enzyme